ncbi:MAG TPA: alpha/beta hydrolase-fold protein [Ferruginibacter sp.]|nr:alpha/beta hydrolase-fold protein [Ferruginibacter sp.]HRE64178.1 alpha/beta hydrolase-fold protein [Ferruginibacter sp.]
MKSLLSFAALLLQATIALTQSNQTICIGKKEIVVSKILNENRTLWIYHPSSTSAFAEPKKQYPVLYLLDGNAHFYSTVGIVQQLSQANANGILPEMIIVGIENTQRFRDLSPSADTGKLNPFVHFLADELIPYIDSNYATAPYKILVGHSLGGLTAIDLLTTAPQLFNAIIAIDPSMWYQNEFYLNRTISRLSKQNVAGKKLFVATANTMPPGMKLSELKSNQAPQTQHIRSIFKLTDFLQGNKNDLSFAYKYYEADNHNSVPLIAQYDGLRFIYDYYPLQATEKDFIDSNDVIAQKLKEHYAFISQKMGYRQTAPEVFVNYLANDAFDKKQYKKAEALFTLNIDWYPNSIKALSSYADYHLAKNDSSNAIVFYKKALQINNQPEIIKKLEELTSKKSNIPTTKELIKYTGVYQLQLYNIPIVLQLKDTKLWAIVPGQDDEEFVWVTENVFTVKNKLGYSITFKMNGNVPVEFTSVQPNGTFTAVFEKK